MSLTVALAIVGALLIVALVVHGAWSARLAAARRAEAAPVDAAPAEGEAARREPALDAPSAATAGPR
ncbi:MAG TPA: cell division protein FtsZ, partial [Burkholderiaceae bacterium]|nr:cell division protein FtsZ [Burkholderiaceae bacterium]